MGAGMRREACGWRFDNRLWAGDRRVDEVMGKVQERCGRPRSSSASQGLPEHSPTFGKNAFSFWLTGCRRRSVQHAAMCWTGDRRP